MVDNKGSLRLDLEVDGVLELAVGIRERVLDSTPGRVVDDTLRRASDVRGGLRAASEEEGSNAKGVE